MGKPAARMGDMTAHGGSIVLGLPTVLIGGMPAARLGDMHVCPMMTPGVPPIPHVGGPVSLGSAGVFIGGVPAARVGDMLVCVGPPDTIAMGCMTVLIGEASPGGGGGGGGGSSGSSAANASAKTALSDNAEATTKEKHWIEFEFVDKAGNAISGINYKLTDTDRKDSESNLRVDGKIRRDALKEGEAKVILKFLQNPSWSKDKAKVGDKVKLKVESSGFENNTKVEFNIYIKDANYADHLLERLESKISGDKAEAEWELKIDEKFTGIIEYKENKKRYSQPFFYFDVYCDGMKASSDLLYYEDWVELQFKDEKGNVLADKKYKIYLPTGEIKEGKLDSSGKTKVEKISPGKIDITLIP